MPKLKTSIFNTTINIDDMFKSVGILLHLDQLDQLNVDTRQMTQNQQGTLHGF